MAPPARRRRPLGTITRGTTNPNRLRRVDRWLASVQAERLRRADDPLVVDLGYGASPVTTLELAARLRRVRADVEVVGLEIHPERVRAAAPYAGDGVSFALGGFDLELPGELAGRRPVVVRALNVLRQYDEADVAAAWSVLAGRLADGGLIVDGTCDEIGRRAAWLAVERGSNDTGGSNGTSSTGGTAGPASLTLSMRLAGLGLPSEVAERLPKALIHRNIPGEPVHAWLQALDDAWARAAPLSSYGPRQRFVAAVRSCRDAGWPVLGGPARWRLGEVSVTWPLTPPG